MSDVLKISDIKKMEASSVNEKVSSLRKEFFDMKISQKTSGLPKPHQLKVIRKNIARLLTFKRSGK